MEHAKKITLKTKLALAVTITFWASAFPAIRAGLEGYSPGGMALLRFLVASLCMLLIYINLKRKTWINLKDGFLLCLIGAMTIGTYHIALNYGEQTISAGVASFIVSLMPVFTVILARFLLNEAMNIKTILGIIISVLGVGIMTLQGKQPIGFSYGFLCVVLSAFAGGVYSVLQKPFLKKYHAIDVTAYIIWGATLFLLMFTPDLMHDFSKAPLQATIASIYLGVFPAAVSYLLWAYALSEIPASRAAISMYFLPILATFLGWIWLGEIPTSFSIFGGCIILVGVWIVNHSFRTKIVSN